MRLSAVNFIRKSWSQSFNNGTVYHRVGFKCICAFPDNTLSSLTNFLSEQLNLDDQSAVAISEISYPSMYQKVTEGKFMFFQKKIRSHQVSITWDLVSTLPLRILLKPWTFSFKKDTITTKTVSKLKYLEERKKMKFTFQMEDPVLHSLVRIWDTFLEVMLVMNLE